jgi:uncharacterized protein YraI
MRRVLLVLVLLFGAVRLFGAEQASVEERWVLGRYVVEGRVDTGSGRQALNVRSGPGTSYQALGALNYGTDVTVYETRGDGWVRISKGPEAPVAVSVAPEAPVSDEERWIIGQFVKNGRVDTGETDAILNVRSGAGDSFPVVGDVRHGELITVFNEQDGWLRMTPASNDPKWVLGKYVQHGNEGTVDTGGSGAALTVHSGPGVKFSRLDQLASGAPVTISAVAGGWFCISPIESPEVEPDLQVVSEGPGLQMLLLGSSGIFLLLLLRQQKDDA